MIVAVGMVLAPPAVADSADTLRSAVATVRAGTSCGPLRYDPIAEQAAEFVVESTDLYVDHNARSVPIADPLPTLKDLGSGATKAKLLQGAGLTEADAIKFVLVSGYAAIPDCTYTDFGGSIMQNSKDGYFLTAVVLTGT